MKHSKWLQSSISERFKRRRFEKLNQLCGGRLTNPKRPIRILDVGCAQGKDVLRFIPDHPNITLYGLDIKEYPMLNPKARLIIGDAANMPFEDDYFDIVVSVGMLEHIQPMENMCQVIQEIKRVSKEFYIMVPAITTPYEPHTHQFRWGLRRSRKHHPWLLFFDDQTWLKFTGFAQSEVMRYWYIPAFICNLIIYDNPTSHQRAVEREQRKLWQRYRY